MLELDYLLDTNACNWCHFYFLFDFPLSASAVADTCVAMGQWVNNPTAHTAMDDILPCVDNATAQQTLARSKEVTYQLVNIVDQVITNVTNVNYPPGLQPLYFNQSGPLMPVLCNPYHSDFSDRKCAAGEVELKDAREVIFNFKSQLPVLWSEPETFLARNLFTRTSSSFF